MHLNIASLRLHIEELEHFLLKTKIKFDIIGISETGLKNNLLLPYRLFH